MSSWLNAGKEKNLQPVICLQSSPAFSTCQIMYFPSVCLQVSSTAAPEASVIDFRESCPPNL